MRDVTGVVTRMGQVTIPAAMRQAPGIHEGDRMAIRLEADAVILRPASTLVTQLVSYSGREPAPHAAADDIDGAVAAGFAEDEEAHISEVRG
jgi:AbrB family looped-hinge helix DNA binding protein